MLSSETFQSLTWKKRAAKGEELMLTNYEELPNRDLDKWYFQKHISLLMFDFQNVFGLTCKIYLSQISKSIFLLFLKAYLLLYRYIALSEFRELIQSSTIIMAQLSSREGPRMWRIWPSSLSIAGHLEFYPQTWHGLTSGNLPFYQGSNMVQNISTTDISHFLLTFALSSLYTDKNHKMT